MNDAITHAISADGPATVAAISAPNSQPDPMIDPTDDHNRPRKPMPRSRPSPSPATSASTFCGGAATLGAVAVMLIGGSCSRGAGSVSARRLAPSGRAVVRTGLRHLVCACTYREDP